MKILVLNGPNLNLLGYRTLTEGEEMTLTQMEKDLSRYGMEAYDELELVFYQTNHEGQLIDMIQKAHLQYAGLILNPSMLCFYSLILQNTVANAELPVVEVLLHGFGGEENALRTSLIAEVAEAHFAGKDVEPYREALDYLAQRYYAQGTND